ncbi:protein BIG GRAIN 1-like A [Diospyros lotus]|uniref:protein BIG GRAIN 1-like A n=1 Tax=Diospyros lotus TaxID=55363 RepID=UPI002254724F|nr:protein BIG GRAIN 1-like A [Diospyros lotus]
MRSWEKSLRNDGLRRNPPIQSLSSSLPSFSSTLLDEIYRSIDGGKDKYDEMKLYKERNSKKQSSGGVVTSVKAKGKGKPSSSIDDEKAASFRWKEKKANGDKVSSGRRRQSLSPELDRRNIWNPQNHGGDALFYSSYSSCSDSSSGGVSSSDAEFPAKPISTASRFTASRPKPVRTSVSSAQSEKLGTASYYEQSDNCLFDDYLNHHHWKNPGGSKHDDDGLTKTRSRAARICSNLKKIKQPISPGGKLVSFLNSLFTNGNSKKTKSCSSIYEEDACVERKANPVQESTCSSASSFSRSCLSKASKNSNNEKASNGIKRTVRFYPVSVIVDEDSRPCGHKSIYADDFGKREARKAERERKIEEAARDFLRKYAKNDEEVNDAASDSSSDLFELDHLAPIGNNERYCEELPVYETTNLGKNRAIASGLIP